MKKIIFCSTLLLSLFSLNTHAQGQVLSLPASTFVAPYKLWVGYGTTTVLVFPIAVLNGDRGSSEIVVQKETGVENVLKLKAGRKDFAPTNLHVYTTDGRIFSFLVEYAEMPSQLTYNLNNLEGTPVRKSSLLIKTTVTPFEIEELANRARHSKSFLSVRKSIDGIRLQLQSIHLSKEVFFFCFSLQNKTSLPYDVDYLRLYLKDKQRGKRTSSQEQELTPVFVDTLQQVKGKGKNKLVIAVPRFTIPKNKVFHIDLFEKNGGRQLPLKIKSSHLQSAKEI